MFRKYGVKPCECKAAMRPKWSSTQPKVFVCQRCGKPVPGYEPLWIQREKWIAHILPTIVR